MYAARRCSSAAWPSGCTAFINNKNGEFAEFGEANAVNKELGAAGLCDRIRRRRADVPRHTRAAKSVPSVTVAPGQVKVSKQDLVVTTW